MSLYHTQTTTISDAGCLMLALQAKGFAPHRHAVAVPLEGYHGDLRKETAEIVIPRAQVGTASNDIGFKRQKNGSYAAIISAFDSRRYDAAWLKDVKLRALEAHGAKIAAKQGDYRPAVRTVLPNGQVKLEFVHRGA